ncbi:unnamed protein product, partial [Protopolystoma xenopodis]
FPNDENYAGWFRQGEFSGHGTYHSQSQAVAVAIGLQAPMSSEDELSGIVEQVYIGNWVGNERQGYGVAEVVRSEFSIPTNID